MLPNADRAGTYTKDASRSAAGTYTAHTPSVASGASQPAAHHRHHNNGIDSHQPQHQRYQQQHPQQHQHQRQHSQHPPADRPGGGIDLEKEVAVLRDEVNRLKQQDQQSREVITQREEGYVKKINELEYKEKQRQTHVTTCMTTIHCLVSELQEIFKLQKVVAANEARQGGSSAAGVVHQLFTGEAFQPKPRVSTPKAPHV